MKLKLKQVLVQHCSMRPSPRFLNKNKILNMSFKNLIVMEGSVAVSSTREIMPGDSKHMMHSYDFFMKLRQTLASPS